jgi:ArsR family transcriptional regulator
VTELTEQLDVPQPTASRHLKVLRERRLVVTERKGTSVLYSLADDRVIDALDTMRAVLMGGINQTAALARGLD